MPGRHGLSIRSADAGDCEAIAQLMKSAGMPAAGGGLAERLEAITRRSGAVLVAQDWGPLCGVVALNWQWVLSMETQVAFVTMLLVDPEQRRRGVGRLLVKAASQIARSASCSDLRLNPLQTADHLYDFCIATGFAHMGPSLIRPLRKRA